MATKKQLESEIDQLKLELHTKKYIHITMPSWKGFGKLILTLLTATLSCFNFMLILKIWKDYNLGYIFASPSEMINYSPKFADLIILCPIIGEYILISLTIIFTVSLFKKLKGYDEGDFVVELVWGLVGGLIWGLVGGLIWGLVSGLVVGVIYGVIIGVNAVLVATEVNELRGGLEDEFD
jgi:hypothetical protein